MQLTNIKTPNGTNYEEYAQYLKLFLVVINVDLMLREELVVIDNLTLIQRAYCEGFIRRKYA